MLDPETRKPTLWSQARANPVTALFILANVGWFLFAESHGSTMDPETLLRFGAVEPMHVHAGEPWRMASYMFLHIGWVHLIWNSWAGASWCAAVERSVGRLNFLVIYLAAGTGGGAASVLFSPAISAGASGAMFGMVGATLAIRLRELRSFAAFTADRGVRSTLGNIALWTVIGIVAMPMNHYAHFGGLLVGALATLIATSRTARAPKWALFAVGFVALVVFAWRAPLVFARSNPIAMVDFSKVVMTSSRMPAGADPDQVRRAAPTACRLGQQRACVVVAVALLDLDNPREAERALALVHHACDVGDMEGCAAEGDFYLSGTAVHQDLKEGFRLASKACEGGSAWGCELDKLHETVESAPME